MISQYTFSGIRSPGSSESAIRGAGDGSGARLWGADLTAENTVSVYARSGIDLMTRPELSFDERRPPSSLARPGG
jgi:hypothetical protein